MLGLPNSSVFREENLQKSFGVISFFISGPSSSSPSEKGGVLWSRICGPGVLLSVDEDSETHQLQSFWELLYPSGDKLLHSWGPPSSPFGEGAEQSSGLFFGVGKMETHSQCLLETGGCTVSLFWMKMPLAKPLADMHNFEGMV